MSDSSRLRSSASTWMATRKELFDVGAQVTSTSRSCSVRRFAALTQSVRCTETPAPRVTKPRMPSPGTGVQHLASFTHRSLAPTTSMPVSDESVLRRRRPVTTWSSLVSSAVASSPPSTLISRLMTAWAPTLPSPTAAYRAGDVGQLEVSGDRRQVLQGEQPLQRQAALAHLPGQGVLAGLDGFLAPLPGEVVPDLVARARAADEAQPVPARSGAFGLGGEDLHDVAVAQRGLQRHQPAVDPGTDGGVADLGVDRVREVDRRRTLRQGDDVAARGEGVDLGRVDLEPQRRPGTRPDRPFRAASPRAGAPRRRSPASLLLGRHGGALRPPCTSSAPPRRTRPGGASRRSGSAARPGGLRDPAPWCAGTGTC